MTETPQWIADLIAATGRFESLCDQSLANSEKFVNELKKDQKDLALTK